MSARDHPPESTELPNYIDYVEGLIGDGLKPSNAAIVRGMSPSRLAELREKNLAAGYEPYYAYCDAPKPRTWPAEDDPSWLSMTLDALRKAPTPYELVAGERGEFRPILHGGIHRAAAAFGGDSSYTLVKSDPDARLAALKRYLLYAHRIVLPDPLFYVNQFFQIPTSKFNEDLLEKGREALIVFLDFLDSIRDLVKRGIVAFYPQYEHSTKTELFRDQAFKSWVSAADTDADEEILYRGGQPRVSELLFFCERFEADCSFDQPQLEPVLAAMTAFGGELQATQLRDRVLGKDRAALQALGSVALPGLDRLSMKEIVDVRCNAEGFHRWRAALGDGLRRIEGEAEPEEVAEAVREELALGLGQVEGEVKSSSLLATARGPGQGFTIGAITGLAVGGPPAALVGGAASAALATLVEYIRGGKRRAGAKALSAHYSVWES